MGKPPDKANIDEFAKVFFHELHALQSPAMTARGPGFAVLYRWKLHPGSEDVFVKAWSRISGLLLAQHGSLGSRLHRGADGLWYSYAQWPSAQARGKAFAAGPVDPESAGQMQAAIAEQLPEVILEPVADFLVAAPRPDD